MTDRHRNVHPENLFNLSRFLRAQEKTFDRALAELKRGLKQSHWMWFIFPQVDGLGNSPTTKEYSIKSLDEARAYLEHPVLGDRLIKSARAILDFHGRTAREIVGEIDETKLKSSMTLFAYVAGSDPVFGRVLDKYFGGERDTKTIAILNRNNEVGRNTNS